MYTIKKILKAVIILIVTLWVAFFAIIIYAVITDYKPEKEEIISSSQSPSKLSDSTLITVLTWNIGYCGLDDSMDFFYDGGTKVITPRERFDQNYEAISAFLKSNDTLNFMLLQEVDRNSKRSYRLDEYNAIEEKLDYNSSQFA